MMSTKFCRYNHTPPSRLPSWFYHKQSWTQRRDSYCHGRRWRHARLRRCADSSPSCSPQL